ncbi:MAG: hypothetical protein E6I05_05930 [Chloroflexi bacterium]|nr:MAG: hypothetical protein E6I15_06460 [Chloroflexota bacterium]TMF93615.1 MAG: hypothetical protein E6I05_05930 [Chloroflexota bacterium]TMG45388.1 MAG: hypothetical protein E6H85_04940 [Chloroflexota bacterium]
MDERAAFKTIGHAIRHRFYVLIAILALFLIGAGVASVIRPPVYQGTAVLRVDERINASQGFDLALQAGELLSAHFIQSATSQPVLQRACSGPNLAKTPLPSLTCTATSLALRVSANTTRGGANWIAVSVTASSAADAAALADAVAYAMMDQNAADIDQLIAPTREYLQNELTRINTEIATVQANLAKVPPSPLTSPATTAEQTHLTLLQSEYGSTYDKLQALATEQQRLSGSLTLVQTASPPVKPIDPDPLRYLAIALVAGLCIGLAAVVLLDRFDDRLFETEALSQAAGTRLVIAVSHKDALTARAEPYALARANLLAQHPHMRKLLVVAASRRDLVRPIAAGLGLAGVKAGQKVLVVDADANTYVMQQQHGMNGSRMTIVSAPPDPDVRIANEAAGQEDDKYDLTIMSAPSPDRDSTAVSLARTVDLAIVVATAKTTRSSDVRRTAEALRLAGIQVVASIFATDAAKEAPAEPETPAKEVYEVAANQYRLPTWRGPTGS